MFDFVKKLVPARIKRTMRSLLFAKEMALPPAPRILVFLAADYGNIGDLAITAAQQKFLERELPEYRVFCIPISATRELMSSLRRQVENRDLITTIGGGNMGSLYPDIEELRQLVIRSFPNNRIVCFPQTLDWDESRQSRQALARITRVYSQHSDLHVYAREAVSYKKLNELFANRPTVKVAFVPDIVLSTTAEQLGAKGVATARRALLCLRDDRERSLSDAHREALKAALDGAGLATEVTDTHAGGSRLSHEHCSKLLAGKLTQFQGAQLVVTDRLHGMILAALAGTPCLVLPNSNHKIRQTWVDWLRDVPQVRFLGLNDFAGIGEAIRELLATPRRDPATPVIDHSHYDSLRRALTYS